MISSFFSPLQISLKEGYQPSKKSDMKSTKKPNILDKGPAKKQLSANASKDNTPSPPGSPAPALTSALNQRIEELVSELQKMKAIILKHEVRIRDLEKTTEQIKDGSLDNHNLQTGSEANNNGEALGPDEV